MYNYQNYPAYQMPLQQQQIVQPQYPTIYGKVVDSFDAAKSADVPIGGYAIFPKGDFSEVYLKSWNPDGTTKMVSFLPKNLSNKEDPYIDILKNIQKSLDRLVQPSTPKSGKNREGGNNEQ